MSNRKFLNLHGSMIPFVLLPGMNFWISEPLLPQLGYWKAFLSRIPPLSQNPWIVSSIITSMDGKPRPGTSHERIGACDLAPIVSWESPFKSNGSSPLLYNNRLFAENLLRIVAPISPAAYYLEQDHIHIGFTSSPGVYFYKEYAKYSADAGLSMSDRGGKVLRLLPSGATQPVDVNEYSLPEYHTNVLTRNLLIRK